MDPDIHDLAGVWATHFRTAVTPDGLTLDFIREDPFGSGTVLVARVACSHSTFGDLATALGSAWHDWVWKSSSEED